MFYERRRQNVGAPRDLRTAAEMHRVIYHALRDHDPDEAREAMREHLAQSQAQSVEDLAQDESDHDSDHTGRKSDA